MKNKIYKTIILLFLLNISMYLPSYSQGFTSATVGENAAGVGSISPSHTGSDIFQDPVAKFVYKVSVWNDGGTSPGIAWEVYDYNNPHYSYSGSDTFLVTSNIFHSDVCIVKDQSGNGKVYAIAVWAAGNSPNSWDIEVFEWQSLGNHFVSTGVYLLYNGGSFGTTINIDGDDAGRIIIVFDDHSKNIYAVAGYVNNGLYLVDYVGYGVQAAYYTSSPLLLGYSGSYPDACIYHYNNSTVTVHVTYIDANGKLAVQDHNYITKLLAYNNLSSSPITPVAPTGLFSFTFPRIACPKTIGTNDVDDWTVVVEYVDRTNAVYKMAGYNDYKTTLSGLVVYNDGSMTPLCNISGFANYLPVVTYDDQSPPNVWVGWTVDKAGGTSTCTNFFNAMYPIVLQCDKYAAINSSSYLIVPYTLYTNDRVSGLSLAARYASDSLFLTYYNVNSSYDIHTKRVQSSSGVLRNASNNGFNQFSDEPENNLLGSSINADSPITVKLFDLRGNLILNEKNTTDKIGETLKRNIKNIPNSVYLVQIVSDDGKYNITKKVFIGN